MSSIEETSRGALREMRALLGVLRNEETPGAAPARDWSRRRDWPT